MNLPPAALLATKCMLDFDRSVQKCRELEEASFFMKNHCSATTLKATRCTVVQSSRLKGLGSSDDITHQQLVDGQML